METPSHKSSSLKSSEDVRKLSLQKTGKDVIQSPYNKVDIKTIDFKPRPKKKIIKGYPTNIDINDFMKQLTYKKMTKLKNKFRSKVASLDKTISQRLFKEIMTDMFTHKPTDARSKASVKKIPCDSLRDLIYKRFRPLKFTEGGLELDNHTQEMMVIDMMIGLSLLSTAIPKQSDKLRLIFSLCDDDGDHCMRPDEILIMLQRLERIF